MPKVSGPLFSFKATGTLGGALTYKKGIEGQRVEKVPRPSDRRSAAQAIQRTSFQECVASWHELPNVMREYCRERGEALSMTAYNYALREWLSGRSLPSEIKGGTQYRISVLHASHVDYGLGYPVTYKFEIPNDLDIGRAWHRHSTEDGWTELDKKSAGEIFNGIEAVRFDYENNLAYISIRFDEASDDIFIVISDVDGKGVDITYVSMCGYYDNRKCLVMITSDDYSSGGSDWDNHAQICASNEVVDTFGVITHGPGNNINWTELQTKVDGGYVEATGHSRTHPHVPYANPDSEIGGCADDIKNYLTLPLNYRKEATNYVPGWIEPFGESDATVRAKLGQYKYLADRLVGTGGSAWASWDEGNGIYNRNTPYVFLDDAGETNLTVLNAGFDTVYASGGIYQAWGPPWNIEDYTPGGYFSQHIAYIGNRNDVWYAGMGAAYMYHYCVERGKITVQVAA